MGCLLFSDEILDWWEATKYCRSRDSYLVEIVTSEQMTFMVQELQFFEQLMGEHSWWTGGTDVHQEGDYYWAHSLNPVEEYVWVIGDPSGDVLSNYLCLSYPDVYLGRECYGSAKFVCQNKEF